MPSPRRFTRRANTQIRKRIKKGKIWIVPNGQYLVAQDNSGSGLDVFWNGQLLVPGVGADYQEYGRPGGRSSRIKFNINIDRGVISTIIY